MGNLVELQLKNVYRTGKDDLYSDFYKKALSVSVAYDRAVGYFSADILSVSLKGLGTLLKSDGRMRLIIGHPLSNEEFNAVKHGVILRNTRTELSERLEQLIVHNHEEYPRLELLALLIAAGKLEIKFALRKEGMYHEKIGIFTDENGNKVVFQGSANETPHGLLATLNAESVSVYKSWEEQIFAAYGQEFLDGFEQLWRNDDADTITLDVPSETYKKIANSVERDISRINNIHLFEDELELRNLDSQRSEPFIPTTINGKEFQVFDHQRKALSAWKVNSFKGILKLATGSGKTITSIYGAVKLFEAKKKQNQQLMLVVLVPYVELANQWIENLKIFGIIAHQCYENKASWFQNFKRQAEYFQAGVSPFCAAVVVNRTLSSTHFQELIKPVAPQSLMVIGDECHNHGSENVSQSLPHAYYRMGLSATPFRTDDDEFDSPFPNDAKERLISYYGDVITEYGLDDAIHHGVLTPYEYHIVPVYLTDYEQEQFEELSASITKLILKQQSSGLTKEERENLTKFCGKRSRLLGSSKNKLVKLEEITKEVPLDDRAHTLFYAGEGKPFSESDHADEDVNVIDKVSKVLRKNGWKTSQFTGQVSKSERQYLMSSFKDKSIDALVAMKVLDEGIDVPVCQTAYILASTRNPRQYIQRRGRILRKYEGKHTARIYDFVILPINDNSASKKLKAAEAERINDFSLLAVNKIEIEHFIEQHGLSYDIN